MLCYELCIWKDTKNENEVLKWILRATLQIEIAAASWFGIRTISDKWTEIQAVNLLKSPPIS